MLGRSLGWFKGDPGMGGFGLGGGLRFLGVSLGWLCGLRESLGWFGEFGLGRSWGFMGSPWVGFEVFRLVSGVPGFGQTCFRGVLGIFGMFLEWERSMFGVPGAF